MEQTEKQIIVIYRDLREMLHIFESSRPIWYGIYGTAMNKSDTSSELLQACISTYMEV